MNIPALKLAPSYSALALSLILLPGPFPLPGIGPAPQVIPTHPPASQQVQPDKWVNAINAAEKAMLANDINAAEHFLREALLRAQGDSARTIMTLHVMDDFYASTDNWKAEERVLVSLTSALKNLPDGQLQLAQAYSKLAALKTDTYSKLAEAYAIKAVQAYRQAHETSNDDYACVLDNLASIEAQEGKFILAEKHYKAALIVFQKLGSPHDMVIGMVENNLGELYMAWGKPDLAIPCFKQAIKVLKPITPPDDSFLRTIKHRLNDARHKQRLMHINDLDDSFGSLAQAR